MILSNLQNFSS